MQGPKFAVRGELIQEDFSIELEKMICKRKYKSIDDSAKTTEFDQAQPSQTGSSFSAKKLQRDISSDSLTSAKTGSSFPAKNVHLHRDGSSGSLPIVGKIFQPIKSRHSMFILKSTFLLLCRRRVQKHRTKRSSKAECRQNQLNGYRCI